MTLATRGESNDAVETLRDLNRKQCETRVLDPACSSGSFYYVAFPATFTGVTHPAHAEAFNPTRSLVSLAADCLYPNQRARRLCYVRVVNVHKPVQLHAVLDTALLEATTIATSYERALMLFANYPVNEVGSSVH